MKRFIKFFGAIVIVMLLAACGDKSQQSVVKDLEKTWKNASYELSATMEIKTGSEPRLYNVNVWHTKPDFYRVEIKENNKEDAQIIVKNKDGVFLVSTSSNKTYEFQSDWPKKNSQSYLIGTLAEDIAADGKAAMDTQDKEYIFEVATRNAERTGLPLQQIVVDKKTLLPSKVSILKEDLTEQIVISFNTIDLKAKHKPEDYAISKLEPTQASAPTEPEEFKVYYPTLQLPNTSLADEKIVKDKGKERAVLSYDGDKSFTIVQQPSSTSDKTITVSLQGDPELIGSSIGAINDQSITWDFNGMTFLLISNKLTTPELLEVAASMQSGAK